MTLRHYGSDDHSESFRWCADIWTRLGQKVGRTVKCSHLIHIFDPDFPSWRLANEDVMTVTDRDLQSESSTWWHNQI